MMTYRIRGRRKTFYEKLVPIAQICFFIAICVTLFFALSPSDGIGGHLIPWDKALHYLCFLVLCGLALSAFPTGNLLVIAIALSAFGALIEYLQGLAFFHRDRELMDWVAENFAIFTIYCALLAGKIRAAFTRQ
jgi:hypothetical protein